MRDRLPQLAHDDLGTGPAALLLHSGIADRRMWHDVAAGLSRSFRVVAPDLRGFGESPLPGVEFSDADDLAFLLDELGVREAVVVGSSLGGRVALELTAAHPDRVSSLVLLCPGYRGATRTAAAEAFTETEGRLFGAGDLAGVVGLNVSTWLGPEATEETRELVATMHRHALDVQLAAESSTPPPRRVSVDVLPAAIGVPAVVVEGGHDMDHFRAGARLLAREIPGARLVTLPWAGHLPSLERPRELTSWLLEVLRDAPGAASS